MKRSKERLYGTKEVVMIAGVTPSDVYNFAQPPYDLRPAQLLGGGGRGSRRLYTLGDVIRIAIARELIECGLGPESVGRGVRAISESRLPKSVDWQGDPEFWKNAPVLVSRRGRWSVVGDKGLSRICMEISKGCLHGVFVLDLGSVANNIVNRVRVFAGQWPQTPKVVNCGNL